VDIIENRYRMIIEPERSDKTISDIGAEWPMYPRSDIAKQGYPSMPFIQVSNSWLVTYYEQ